VDANKTLKMKELCIFLAAKERKERKEKN